ncbi:hypothetical protein A4A49_38986 [Nicotiana attenuata]|uniref:Uncharacterized protein n=1 Tax=Nicotiana attenuata TaxID=49451 RepID=A0A1J6JSP9_NICAT|nr:hypothetical protein A4A49_38986 [Nicotiana attenuata]
MFPLLQNSNVSMPFVSVIVFLKSPLREFYLFNCFNQGFDQSFIFISTSPLQTKFERSCQIQSKSILLKA